MAYGPQPVVVHPSVAAPAAHVPFSQAHQVHAQVRVPLCSFCGEIRLIKVYNLSLSWMNLFAGQIQLFNRSGVQFHCIHWKECDTLNDPKYLKASC